MHTWWSTDGNLEHPDLNNMPAHHTTIVILSLSPELLEPLIQYHIYNRRCEVREGIPEFEGDIRNTPGKQETGS
jgi:hypothetical protein